MPWWHCMTPCFTCFPRSCHLPWRSDTEVWTQSRANHAPHRRRRLPWTQFRPGGVCARSHRSTTGQGHRSYSCHHSSKASVNWTELNWTRMGWGGRGGGLPGIGRWFMYLETWVDWNSSSWILEGGRLWSDCGPLLISLHLWDSKEALGGRGSGGPAWRSSLTVVVQIQPLQ